MSYHLLTDLGQLAQQDSRLIIAGDGVYATIRIGGAISIPYPLVLCEIRGLVPLASLLFETVEPRTSTYLANPLPFAPSHHVLEGVEQPVLDSTRIFQYVIAREGVFLLASCPSIELLLPISPLCSLPGLASVKPFITWNYPRVSEDVVDRLFERAREAKSTQQGSLLEWLFYLTFDEGTWQIHEPEQEQKTTKVAALSSSDADERAPIEGHSHHHMRAFFSPTDNTDELVHGGFKVYIVLGCVDQHPEILTRICVHGYSWVVSAHWFFSLPSHVRDCGETQVGGM